MSYNRILIMKFRNIGDVLLITPMIQHLKHYYPTARIDVAVNKGCEEILLDNPHVDNVIILDRQKVKQGGIASRLKHEWSFAKSIRSSQYDMVISATEGDRGAQLSLISGAKLRVGYQPKAKYLSRAFTCLLPHQGKRHTVEQGLDVIRALALPVQHKSVEMHWSKQVSKSVEDILSTNKILNAPFIHIHPVSRWLFKCINDATMTAIVDYCELTLGVKVVLTAAPVQAEADKIESILSHCRSKPINLSGQLSLTQTACLNSQSLFFIGVDTAIMHMSAANNIPVLSFFGPSGANHWGPWDNQSHESGYLRTNGCQQMGRHRVISESRACQPCGRDGCNGSKISDCLMSLDLKAIYTVLNEMLNENQSTTHRVV